MLNCFKIILILLFVMPPLAQAMAKSDAHHPTAPKQLIPDVPPVIATYDVYVGGIEFISADIHFQQKKDKYQAQVIAHTKGFWYRLFPWDAELVTHGMIVKDHFVPVEFSTHDAWGKKVKTTKLHFKKNGDIVAEFDPPKNDDDHDQVTIDQKRGSLDPVTALLQLLAHLSVAKDCNTTVPLFDGKIRFDIATTDVGSEDIDEEDYGMYKGNARTCDASFKLIAGEWKEKVKSRFWYKNENERGREPFHIWLAKPVAGLPELPVKLESGSIWGLVVVHLSAWHYDTAPAVPSAETKP
jgi:hypothetical protein